MFRHAFYKASTATMARLKKFEAFKGFSGKVENMDSDGDQRITRLLFCGPYFPASHNYTREYVHNYPFIKVDDVPFADVPNVIGNYDMCIVKDMRLNADVISHASRMKLIMQYGVGLEGIDINAATRHGIKVARIPSGATGNASSCAEMAIYLMLGLLRKQNEMQLAIKKKKLGEPAGETLLGKTVFIMGFGNIGIHLAKRLRPFDVKILATKRSWDLQKPHKSDGMSSASPTQNGTNDDLVDEKGGHEDIHTFASNADIVGALLVNIARGGLLDYEAVLCHLKSGHLGGLGIDVAWTEPFDPDDPILKFPNVLITPHVAGVTEQSYRSMAKVVGDVALQLHAGTPLTGIEFVN
ncbi:D-isomer specific 2-hydroxyacid dehydrogenase family protein [Actinidia rufa]|uniref:D-isomer specific 2-hydroxyacid dehydrogenase family protein n=1 Tax=Actinidia rufa TaxID=165716 RepID=A0A7J0DUU3_9ERIC|nr:D-isomer specific 2-hydroxyacid dehydrogenase family protein [Actinidia rufa]